MAHSSQPGVPGLMRLESLRTVHVRQKTTFLENNKYVVMTPEGEVILYAKEDSGAMNRLFWGKNRAFEINISDVQHTEVVRLRRPLTFGPDKMVVTVGGVLVSVVRQEVTFCKAVLNINDERDRPLLRVKGPMDTTVNADFKLFNTQKQQVGLIGKRWGGFEREAFTSSDNFEITFPIGASVELKAAIIGTCFLIESSDLASLDTVLVRQTATRLAENKYTVQSTDGEVLLYAKENYSTLTKYFGSKKRAFEIDIFDVHNTPVVRLRRPATFGPDKMDVSVYGRLVSVVRQAKTFLKPILNINDAQDQPFLRAKGPTARTGDLDFRILDTNKQQIGVIRKKWEGWIKGICANKDSYYIEFPPNASLDVKAAIIGTSFLMDFLYFE